MSIMTRDRQTVITRRHVSKARPDTGGNLELPFVEGWPAELRPNGPIQVDRGPASDGEVRKLAEALFKAHSRYYGVWTEPDRRLPEKVQDRVLDAVTDASRSLAEAMQSRDIVSFTYRGLLFVDCTANRLGQWHHWHDLIGNQFDIVAMIPADQTAAL